MRILVVEDEPLVAASLQSGLEAEGYAVDVASDGVEGLWLATERDYAAVLLDIMLPKLNGYRVCAELRRAERWVPVLMLTAKDGEFDQVDGLDCGADDYLTKPFSYPVLLARLRALLRREPVPRPATLTAGDLRLDPAAHRCWRGEREIPLTAREFGVLELLLRRRGQAVSKLELLHHVWDAAFEGDSNVVEVYVRHLRRKVDEPFGRAAIQTVRGVGYRIAADGG
jgi:two-component system, OmpR family, response regulator